MDSPGFCFNGFFQWILVWYVFVLLDVFQWVNHHFSPDFRLFVCFFSPGMFFQWIPTKNHGKSPCFFPGIHMSFVGKSSLFFHSKSMLFATFFVDFCCSNHQKSKSEVAKELFELMMVQKIQPTVISFLLEMFMDVFSKKMMDFKQSQIEMDELW